MYCRNCYAELHQDQHKALGEPRDGSQFQILWTAENGDWICPANQEEHAATTAHWWHAFAGEVDGLYMMAVAGPTDRGPDDSDLKGTPIKEAVVADRPYVTSWDHHPSDYEKQVATPEEFRDTLKLKLEIENSYELYEDETTYREVEVPLPPPEDTDDFEDWKLDYIFEATGVGHEDGDSWYDVTVLESSREDLVPVGTKYDFGY